MPVWDDGACSENRCTVDGIRGVSLCGIISTVHQYVGVSPKVLHYAFLHHHGRERAKVAEKDGLGILNDFVDKSFFPKMNGGV